MKVANVATFDSIEKSYGDTVALRGVSLEVRTGEVFGLLGPNGAGKTSLIRILMDIIRANSGSMTLFGEPHDRRALGRVGYLPEERGLYAKQKVINVMVYFAMLKGLPRAEAKTRAKAWLEKIELPHVETWRVERLSKGMSQKVQIAATLLTEPELCVLDEPFSGLDPLNVRLVRDMILERRAAGRTTILSTHLMNQVEELCDRVGMVNRGELVVYGTVPEVRARYSLPEIRVKTDGTAPATVGGVVESTDEGNGSWRLLLEAEARPRDVLAALVQAGTPVDEFERVLAPIEDIFVRVVQGEPHGESSGAAS